MIARASFGISVLMSLASSVVLAILFAWPLLRNMPREQALVLLVAPHMFLRFIGLSFLVPGVASQSLPDAWAKPAAYGDLVAGVLAIIAVIALCKGPWWATPAVWLFNVWGAADLLFAMIQGPRMLVNPGALGATFFIPTAIVPPLLVTHGLVFLRLLVPSR